MRARCAAIVLVVLQTSSAFVVCPEEGVVFYHVPRAGGAWVSSALAARGCEVFWGILEAAEFPRVAADPDHLAVDPAHLMPWQLGDFAALDAVRGGRGSFGGARGANFVVDASVPSLFNGTLVARQRAAAAAAAMASFAVVRNPYTRVLSAFARRRLPTYDRHWPCTSRGCGHARHPSTFPEFMRWLAANLRAGKLRWCCDPTIVHFRPAAHFTHWPSSFRSEPKHSGSGARDHRVVDEVGKLETLDADLDRISRSLFPRGPPLRRSGPRTNVGPNGAARRLCGAATGCGEDEADALLNATAHTAETLRITGALYAHDFRLFGYHRFQEAPERTRRAPRVV